MATVLLLALLAAGCAVYAQPPIGIAVGPTAPANAQNGDLWSDTTAGALKRYNGASWSEIGGGQGASVPAGSILFIVSGSCPAGYTEEAALNGRTIIGTLAANSDIGTTGGADSVTPSAHSGTAVADHASHTHTYSDVIAHTHTIPVGATDDTAAPFDRADAGTNASGANATTATGSTGVATGTTAGPSATLTHSVTQPTAHAALDNRSAFVKVIGCRKT